MVSGSGHWVHDDLYQEGEADLGYWALLSGHEKDKEFDFEM